MPKLRVDDRDPKAFSRAYLANFGEKVRTLRERRGVTLKQLAQLSGLSDRYIIQIEQGATNPSLESVLRLALSLQTSAARRREQRNGRTSRSGTENLTAA
jgi:transcriptional regulator with XRE-family HTH domain